MRHHTRRSIFILAFLTILTILLQITPALAKDPKSYCKCTCGTQSMIIPITEDDPKALSCADCNRQFCLSYNLLVCDGVKEEDVFTTCFQRDSIKDQAVVLIFIIATLGLLLYAAIKPWVSRWIDPQSRGTYDPVPSR